MTMLETLRRWSREDRLVQASASQHNLQVLGVAAWALVVLNAVHVLVFLLLRFDDPVRGLWAHQLVLAHGVMGVLMAGAGVLALRARRAGSGLPSPLPVLVCAAVLAWSVLLTAIDQAIAPHISAFINAAVGVAIVFLLHPRTAFFLLAGAWCVLAWTVGLATDDPAQLTTHRMNAASASGLAWLVSVLLWRRYAQAELLRRALTESNEQLERQRAELAQLATRDPLTGLLNRREFVRQAEQALARVRRGAGPLSLLMLDLDHFKAINDLHGHPVGDQVLQHVSQLMQQTVRQSDGLGRFGGEEFVVMLPMTPLDSALQLAERLRQRLGQAPLPGLGQAVTASIGVAACDADSDVPPLDELLRRADEALYEAKRQGRNRVVAAAAAALPA